MQGLVFWLFRFNVLRRIGWFQSRDNLGERESFTGGQWAKAGSLGEKAGENEELVRFNLYIESVFSNVNW